MNSNPNNINNSFRSINTQQQQQSQVQSPCRQNQKLQKMPTFKVRTREVYDKKLSQQSQPVLQSISNLIEEQEIQDRLVNNYQKKFENKKNIKSALEEEMKFLENRKYYGTNDPAKLRIWDLKKSLRHSQDYQYVKLREIDQMTEKIILAKKLKNPDYNSDHDILTRKQILTKLYTAGFNLKDIMSPKQRRQMMQQDQSNLDSISDHSKNPANFSQENDQVLFTEEQGDIIQLQQIQSRNLESKENLPSTQSQLGYMDKKRALKSQQLSKRGSQLQHRQSVNFMDIEKNVEQRKKLNTMDQQELTSQLLQSLRQKMFKELFNPSESVGQKFNTISNMFEQELNEGKRKVYMEKISNQREKQRQEMLSRQQAFNSFYNLMALTKKQKKKINEKQKQETKLKKMFKKLSNNKIFHNSEYNTLNQQNVILDKSDGEDNQNKFSRFTLGSESVQQPKIKGARSKVITGLSTFKNREISNTIKTNPMTYEYSNPYNNKLYKAD